MLCVRMQLGRSASAFRSAEMKFSPFINAKSILISGAALVFALWSEYRQIEKVLKSSVRSVIFVAADISPRRDLYLFIPILLQICRPDGAEKCLFRKLFDLLNTFHPHKLHFLFLSFRRTVSVISTNEVRRNLRFFASLRMTGIAVYAGGKCNSEIVLN